MHTHVGLESDKFSLTSLSNELIGNVQVNSQQIVHFLLRVRIQFNPLMPSERVLSLLTARLDKILCSSAHLIVGGPKCAPISGYMHDTLHRVAVLVLHYLLGIAPIYLQELCRLVSSMVGRSFLFLWQTLSSPGKHLNFGALSQSLLHLYKIHFRYRFD